ncbi:MAG: hypothetical protein K8H88_22025 [Sandaracinaceae bacterium]|nr:hypothetical protein [Sandaracinaceae bacterium]
MHVPVVAMLLVACSTSHAPEDAEPVADRGVVDAGSADSHVMLPDAGMDSCVATEELCNALDDDCDGLVDEDASATCALPHAATECRAGQCVVTGCDLGFGDCTDAPGCETDTDTSAATCGACDYTCGSTIACHDGVCDDERIVDVSAGWYHACAVRASGEALCWGQNTRGQLGTGDLGERLLPAPVIGANDFVRVLSADVYSCGLRRAGALACWGDNASGELGDGTTVSRAMAADVLIPGRVVGFTARRAMGPFSFAWTDDGRLWGWGLNYWGQIREPAAIETLATPVSVARGPFEAVVTTLIGACGLRGERTFECWGLQEAETPPSALTMLDAMVLHGDYGWGLLAGEVWFWGRSGGVAAPFACDPCTEPQRLPLPAPARQVVTGLGRTCALLDTGQVECWGAGLPGQPSTPEPVPVGGLSDVQQIALTAWTTCALDARARVWCWNTSRTGDGTSDERLEPTQVQGLYRLRRGTP